MNRFLLPLVTVFVACSNTLTTEEATKFTQTSFEAALATQGLTLVRLYPIKKSDDRGLLNNPQVTTDTANKPPPDEYAVLLDQGHGQDKIEFVKDEKGTVYRLIRQPEVIQRETVPREGCPPMGSGAIFPDVVLVYSGVAGEKQLQYQAKEVNFDYQKKNCPPAP